MSEGNAKLLTIGSLIKKDLQEAYFLPSWPSSHTRENYRFKNDKKYRVFDCPPPSLTFLHKSFSFRNLPAAGDEVPILLERPPPKFLTEHWKKWLPAFPAAKIKSVDEGLQDEVPIVTTSALQSVPENKHSIHPDVMYKIQLKSEILTIGVPAPKHMDENEVECPCIVKVDQSWSGRGTLLAKNHDELSAVLREIREEYGWKDKILFQELVQNVKEVPSFQFYLQKSGEIFWVGTTTGGFTDGFHWTNAVADWDKQDYYKDLAYDKFTIPISKYLIKQGYFGLVTFELIVTHDGGMYLCDLNPRVGGDTTHLLLAAYMASFGNKHSCLSLNDQLKISAKSLVENANVLNNAKTSRVIVKSAADTEEGCVCDISIFADSFEDLQSLFKQVTKLT